jgi:hypothetical protein
MSLTHHITSCCNRSHSYSPLSEKSKRNECPNSSVIFHFHILMLHYLSFRRICKNTNRVNINTHPIRHPHTRLSPHGSCPDPHCNAKTRLDTEPIKRDVPNGSKLPSFSLRGSFVDALAGVGNAKAVMIMETVPMASE